MNLFDIDFEINKIEKEFEVYPLTVEMKIKMNLLRVTLTCIINRKI